MHLIRITTTTLLGVFLLIIISGVKANQQCGGYEKYGTDHTMCKPADPSCKKRASGVSESEKTGILKYHNTIRAKVARGEVGPSLDGTNFPQGSNIREMVWNDELATIAERLAEQCTMAHDGPNHRKMLSRDYHVGQNIYVQMWWKDLGNFWPTVMEKWQGEYSDTPLSEITSFSQTMVNSKWISHFTQFAWAETNEIGCGAMKFGPCTSPWGGSEHQWCYFYVCNYGPRGNTYGRPVYLRGAPASACPNGVSDTYPDLCK